MAKQPTCELCRKPIEVDDKAEVMHDAKGRMVVHRLCAIESVRLGVDIRDEEDICYEHRQAPSPEELRASWIRKLRLCARAIGSVATEFAVSDARKDGG